MKKRDFINPIVKTWAVISLFIIGALQEPLYAEALKPKYNVLFLMTDQHRPDAMSRYGDAHAITPALDDLAASGMSFRQTYCQSPKCMASRLSILTGRYEHSIGKYFDRGDFSVWTSFAQVLRSNGYKTACFGKLHTPDRDGLDWDVYFTGYEEKKGRRYPKPENAVKVHDLEDAALGAIGAPHYIPEEGHMEWSVKERTIAFMKEHRDQPWMIQCSLHGPHPPFQPPQRYWDMVNPANFKINLPGNSLKDSNPRYKETIAERGYNTFTDEKKRSGMQGYYGNLAQCDATFLEVLNAVDELGLRDNTLVIYVSDHGEMLGQHGLWGKQVFFDASVRVPLIMRLPGVIPEDKQSKALVEAIDIYPTILDITGYKTPASVQGISLVPVISGKNDKHRDVVRCEYPGASFNGKKARALMQFDGRFKVVDNGTDYPPELYDHKTDPHETKNIGADPKYREMLRKTIEELRAWEKTDPPKLKSDPKSSEEKKKRTAEERAKRTETVFKRADKDGDGSISLEEFHGRAKDDELKAKKAESFNKLDKNSDGKLSLEEMTRR